jgi:hypothetical protein
MQRSALCTALLCALTLSACSTTGNEQADTRRDAGAIAASNQPEPAVVVNEAEAKSLDRVELTSPHRLG